MNDNDNKRGEHDMDQKRINEIRVRLARATARPWYRQGYLVIGAGGDTVVCNAANEPEGNYTGTNGPEGYTIAEDDAEFLVHAAEDIEGLVDALLALREGNKKLRKELAALSDACEAAQDNAERLKPPAFVGPVDAMRRVFELEDEIARLKSANGSLIPGAMLTATEIECLRVERDGARAEIQRLKAGVRVWPGGVDSEHHVHARVISDVYTGREPSSWTVVLVSTSDLYEHFDPALRPHVLAPPTAPSYLELVLVEACEALLLGERLPITDHGIYYLAERITNYLRRDPWLTRYHTGGELRVESTWEYDDRMVNRSGRIRLTVGRVSVVIA